MNLKFSSEPQSHAFGTCDIVFDQGNDITDAVLMSLFSYRRCTKAELQDGTQQMGWWADTPAEKWGSKLWLLRRRKMTKDLPVVVKQYCEEALEWLVKDKIVTSINVSTAVSNRDFNRMNIEIRLNRQGDNIVLPISDFWSVINGGV